MLVIFLTLAPLIPFSCFSIGLVTKFSISFGELPTYIVVTLIVGITISGNCSLGKELNFVKPISDTNTATIYTAVLLSTAQDVGRNSLNFFAIPSIIECINTFLFF